MRKLKFHNSIVATEQKDPNMGDDKENINHTSKKTKASLMKASRSHLPVLQNTMI